MLRESYNLEQISKYTKRSEDFLGLILLLHKEVGVLYIIPRFPSSLTVLQNNWTAFCAVLYCQKNACAEIIKSFIKYYVNINMSLGKDETRKKR